MGFVEQARAGLAELARRDRKYEVFGAGSHRYQLERPVRKDRLRRFEARWGFECPADYRAFLLELGDGGAGPGYGVFPLGKIDGSGTELVAWRKWKLDPSAAFPHQRKWNDESLLERGAPDPDDFDQPEEYEQALEDWYDSDAAEEAQRAYERGLGLHLGALPICHHGCALRDWLIVSGPEAGHVWHDASADQLGVMPIRIGRRRRVS
ncbi:MAG TPA: SMI1/KNR4 family protein, partial [Enhygromyxa sp.]|nr:SMI1/KNR4 family protein [Enhygromyxa sp.]